MCSKQELKVISFKIKQEVNKLLIKIKMYFKNHYISPKRRDKCCRFVMFTQRFNQKLYDELHGEVEKNTMVENEKSLSEND